MSNPSEDSNKSLESAEPSHDEDNVEPEIDNVLAENSEESENSPSLSSTEVVKHRTRRQTSEKGKQNQITLLKTNISKCISSRLGIYEKTFSEIDKTDYNAICDYLTFLEDDSNEIDTLYDELKVLCDNKMDEQIENLCAVFYDERKVNIASVNALLDELEETEDQESVRLEEELRRQIEEIEEQRKRQAEARRLFQERPSQDMPHRGITTLQTSNANTNQLGPTQTDMSLNHVVAVNQPLESMRPRHPSTSSHPPTINIENQQRSSRITVTSPIHRVKESPHSSEPDDRSNSSVQALSSKDADLNAMERLATSITESMRATKRTIVEPSIFEGDPMKFKDWETDFDDFLESEAITTSTRRMRMLKRFIDGDARQCIEGFLLDDTVDSYNAARQLLKERFGKRINISRHLKKKLKEWPKIGNTDGLALQQFADFLTHLNSAKQTSPHLNSLDEPECNEEILEKLPSWLKTKWKYQILKYEKTYDDYPPFKVFREFICDEALATNVLGIKDNTKGDKNFESSYQKRSHPRRVQTLQSVSTDNQNKYCKKCDRDNHYTAQCHLMVKATYEETLQFFKQNHLCFGCGKDQHRHNECPRKWKCKFCKREHPDCLHKSRSDWENQKPAHSAPTSFQSNQQQRKEVQKEHVQTAQSAQAEQKSTNQPPKQHIVATANRNSQTELLNMVLPVKLSSENGQQTTIYAMLDNGSDTTYIAEETIKLLKLKPHGKPENVTMRTLTGEETGYRKKYKFRVRGSGPVADGYNYSVDALEQKLIPYNVNHIPTDKVTRTIPHLKHIVHLIAPTKDLPVNMLIGRDNSHLLAPHESVIGDISEPFAIRTVLGWTLCGGNPKIALPQLNCLAAQQDEFEDVSDKKKMSQNDMLFLQTLENGMKRMDDGSISLPLPFSQAPHMPNNKNQATNRLEQLIRKFHNNSKLKEEYFNFMQDMIENGHAELVPEGDTPDGQTWYLPHFAVFHPRKNALRVVFDASVKYGNKCLNEELLPGPDHMNNLAGILLRFRREPVAISCDIQKMFHNFKVDEKDRDYLRFLWVDTNLQTIKEYRMTVHLFGATSSPAVATFALRKLASDAPEEYLKATNFITKNFYVDDGIVSVATEQEAQELIKDTIEVCSNANLRLHKFLSNSRKVLESVPQSEIAKNLQGLDLYKDKLPSERTLGLEWCTNTDTFTFTSTLVEKPPTKRGILSSVSQIYDPLGLLAPFLLRGRLLMQKSCQEEGNWDKEVSPMLQSEWKKWKSDIGQLSKITIPRCLKPDDFGEIVRTEMHYFGDASLTGYGACAYLRIVNRTQRVHVSLVTAKARVVPSKGLTIPRLELQAAVEAVRLAAFIREEIHVPIDQEYFWSDSTATLGYIKNSNTQFYMFTANRVNEIRQHSSPGQWYHIAGSDNPADIISRGASAAQLATGDWYKGPAFLHRPDISNRLKNDNDFREVLKYSPEVRKLQMTLVTDSTAEPFITKITSKFSSWKRLIRAIANVQALLKSKSLKKRNEPTVQQIQEAETIIIKLTQQSNYSQEIEKLKNSEQVSKNSKIRSLTPFLDKAGMLRLNSRSRSNLTYEEKYPLIIPKSNLSKLLVNHFHQLTHHAGANVAVSSLRQTGYWVVGATTTARSMIFNRTKCRIQRSKPMEQIMGLLPKERTEPAPPFTHIGIDVFGHFIAKDRRTEVKRWGIIFTCTYTRGVHIELIDNLSTDSFLQALRRLQAIRGQVKTIFCDNGTNFIGGRNQLEKDLLTMEDTNMKQYLLDNKIQFKTSTPSASHQGGFWERQIRTIRSIFNVMTSKYSCRLTTEGLKTAFMEIAVAINNRPLSTVSSTETEPVITVNHLLTGKSQAIAPPPGDYSSDELYGRSMYRKTQQLAEEFWGMWKSQYLSKIEKRSKWQSEKTDLKVGDLVLVMDDNLPRNFWSTGRIIALHLGADQHVRKASVMIATSELDKDGKTDNARKVLDRPVQKLVLIMST